LFNSEPVCSKNIGSLIFVLESGGPEYAASSSESTDGGGGGGLSYHMEALSMHPTPAGGIFTWL
jgi:hypothetical protein